MNRIEVIGEMVGCAAQRQTVRTDVRGPSLRAGVCEHSTHGLFGPQIAPSSRALELPGAKDGEAFSNSTPTIRGPKRMSIVVTTYFSYHLF